MEYDLLKLPIGIQTFSQIRTEGYLYVDKTEYLLRLIDSGKVYFLSRPRRFGKSLTISTLEALFSGKQELFEGLYAQEYFTRSNYRPYPVVRLDMSCLTTDQGVEELRASLMSLVRGVAKRYGIELEPGSPGKALSDLLEQVAAAHGSVVLLVDEYDKPVWDSLQEREERDAFRKVMRAFYTQIKAADEHLQFVFITGISKFSKAGVFSAMNNLYDISLDATYSQMLGYTEQELLFYFDGYLNTTANTLGMPRTALIDQIRSYYDGFSFDGEHRLYNPFSTLSFFQKKSFSNFWYESGSPGYLAPYIRQFDLNAEEMRGKVVGEDFTSITDIEQIDPASFLFQSGYLTVRAREGLDLVLDYPNREVLSSMSLLCLHTKAEGSGLKSLRSLLEKSIREGRFEEFVLYYNTLLASIPHSIYDREARKYARTKDQIVINNLAESFFHALLFAMVWSSRITVVAETQSSHGRSDIEILYNEHHIVVELKIAPDEKGCEHAAKAGMAQIKSRGYADKLAPGTGTLISIAVNEQARRVGAYRTERI